MWTATSNYVRINKYFSFFAYLPYTIPHAHNELGKKTGNGMEVPNDKPYSSEDWPQPEKNKAAMITRLDDSVGALMAYLKALRIETNTSCFSPVTTVRTRKGESIQSFSTARAGCAALSVTCTRAGFACP
jgi:hypothetical protein